MANRLTDRKKGKEKNETNDNTGTFILPNSLPCSEIDFPVLIERKSKVKWKDILDESKKKAKELLEYEEIKRVPIPKSPFLKTECDFIKNEVFIYLLPAIEETLNKAKLWEALRRQKCFFNGIDHISQLLYNNNPRYPCRKDMDVHIFNMPWVRRHLQLRPRPYYPKSWLWPEEFAATLIQKTVRQYFVQREEEVQEMRDFWKKLDMEKGIPDMDTNPFLAKKFASEPHFRRKPPN